MINNNNNHSTIDINGLLELLDSFPLPPNYSPKMLPKTGSSPEFTRRKSIGLASLLSSSPPTSKLSTSPSTSPLLKRKGRSTSSTSVQRASPKNFTNSGKAASLLESPVKSPHSANDYSTLRPSMTSPSNRPRASTMRPTSSSSPRIKSMDMEFFKKASLSSYNMSQQEQAQLHEKLLQTPKEDMIQLSNQTTQLLAERRKSKFGIFRPKDEFPQCQITKTFLKFGSEKNPQPVNTEVTKELTIINQSNVNANFMIWKGAPNQKFGITFTPHEGVIKKKSTQVVQVGVTLRSTMVLSHLISIEIENGQRFFVVLSGVSDKSVFGVEPDTIPRVSDMGLENIPQVLVTLANYFFENKGDEVLGIFRIAGSDSELHTAKDQLNRGQLEHVKDIHVISNLIKVWFRELPLPLLNVLPPDRKSVV